jgi:hypothetical protein
MKRLILSSLLFAAAAPILLRAATASESPRVTRSTLISSEENLDNRIRQLWNDNPYALSGPTRGVYLDGYGVVFTVEVNLAMGPVIHMFHPTATPAEIAAHRAKKMQRLPEFRRALEAALVNVAATLDAVPDDGQVVLVAILAKYPWEDITGMPQQIMVQGQKKKLVDAKKSGATTFAGVVQVTEN